MLLTCRSTVRSLIVRASAIARLVKPAATRRRTSTSRVLRPPGAAASSASADVPAPASSRARSGVAPNRSNTSRAASVSSAAPSASPSVRQAAAVRTRTRAVSYGRVERRPGLPRPTKDAQRAFDVALCQTDRAIGPERHRPKEWSVEPARPGRRADRPIREQPRRRLPPARSRRRARAVARERGRRLPRPAPAGSPSRLRRRRPGRVVAAHGRARGVAPTNRPRGSRSRPTRTPRAGDRARRAGRSPRRRLGRVAVATATSRARSRLGTRVLPRTMEAHELGAVDEAVAAERDEVRLRIEPARERGCPLLRATQVVQLVAGLDDRAVDDARHDRRDLAGDHRRHRLVEQRQTALDLVHRDQGLPATEPAEGGQIRDRRTDPRSPRPARRSRTRSPDRPTSATAAPRG